MNDSTQSAPVQGQVEKPFFFDIGAEELFGFLHQPRGLLKGGLVLCHAFAEEKLWSHRVYVTFAREAAVAGYAVLRFDMRGEGDSSREFEDSTIETRIEDALRAVQELRRRVPTLPWIRLLGHRFGGSIAAAAAMRSDGAVNGLAIWDPLADGSEYFSQLLRSNQATQLATEGRVTRTRDALIAQLTTGEPVIVDGYGLTADLHRGISALQLAALNGAFARPALIVEVAKGEQSAPSAAIALLAASYPSLRCDVVVEPPFWRETRQFHKRAGEFTRATLQWLGQT